MMKVGALLCLICAVTPFHLQPQRFGSSSKSLFQSVHLRSLMCSAENVAVYPLGGLEFDNVVVLTPEPNTYVPSDGEGSNGQLPISKPLPISANSELTDSKTILELPAPGGSTSNANLDASDEGSIDNHKESTRTIEIGGAAVSMDELGPIIVNLDGTLRRIENWSKLSKQEQMGTIRMVTKRNRKRLDALKALQEEEGTEAGNS